MAVPPIPGGKMATFGAAYAVTKSALGALGQYFSLFLIGLGLVHWLFLRGTDIGGLSSLVMFIIGTIATIGFFRNTDFWEGTPPIKHTFGAWFLPLAFMIWFFFTGRTWESFVYLGVIVGVLWLVYGIGTKGDGAKAVAVGAIPVLFFGLDNALAFVFLELGFDLQDIVQNLVFEVPWWSVLGLLILPTKHVLANIVKVIGVLYIVIVIILPFIPDVGHTSEGLIPGTAEFQEAERELRERLPARENPFVSNLRCITAGRYEDLQACINERQLRSELESICEQRAEEEDLIATDEYLERCIAEEEARRERERIQVSGTRDPTIKEPLEIQFEKGEFFPEKTYRRESEVSRIRYPIDLIIKNPRQQEITAAVSCGFMKMGSSSEEKAVAGKIVGPAEFTVGEASKTQTIVCEPEMPLDGRYTLNYTANFLHLKTFSRLSRAFIGEQLAGESFAEREALKDEVLQAHFSGSTAQSQAPNDPVQLHFAMGNPIDNPLIEGESGLLLAATIKNEGRGDILRINQYSIFLPGFTVDDPRCLDDVDVELLSEETRRTEDLHLPLCSILSLPFELKNPGEQEYFFREFTAELDYDYVLTEDVSVEVEAIS